MANQFLGLSLFIMLLSFFIILNAISSFEETKTQPVLNSLSMAFSNQEVVEDTAPGQMETQSPLTQLGSALDKIQALFTSQITAAQARQNRLGTQMFMRMKFKDFQNAIVSSLTVPKDAPVFISENKYVNMIPLLVSLMQTQEKEQVPYRMDMVLSIEENPSTIAADAPEKFAAYNRSVTVIAEKLEKAGLPKYQVTAGLKQGEPGYIELTFHRYEPFDPLGTRAGIDQQVQDTP